MTTSIDRITSYGFSPGKVVASKYQVVSHMESDWDGELYMLSETSTGIERTAKFFFPHCNPSNRMGRFYARKLHKLRGCPILMQYRTQETIRFRGESITFLVSDLVDGKLASDLLAMQPGRRFQPFEALHLLFALCKGMERIHALGEFHGHLSLDNIIVRRKGLGFEVKVINLHPVTQLSKPELIRADVIDLIRIFYQLIDGKRFYSKLPTEVKQLCCGLKHSLIIERFRNASDLRVALDNLSWK